MARIATEIGLPTNLECSSVVEEAAKMAAKLGHGFVQTHQEKVDQVPDKITLLKIIEIIIMIITTTTITIIHT